MVKIKAKHEFRSKTVTMDISKDILIPAEKGHRWAIQRIFEIYLRLCHYKRSNLHPGSIKFWRVESKTPKQTFVHRTDSLSACEKENCSFCNAGKYEECPNNRHKL